MTAQIFVEGGGDSSQLRNRCREGFRKLFESCGFEGRMPSIYAAGRGRSAFDRFKKAHDVAGDTDYVAMLIDSEFRVTDKDKTWDHLAKRQRAKWRRPSGATNDQVLLMTTCMESWIAADRQALRKRFPRNFNEKRLPDPAGLEARLPAELFSALEHATNGRYSKGNVSFELLGALDPGVLEQHLPSFRRARRILNEKLSR